VPQLQSCKTRTGNAAPTDAKEFTMKRIVDFFSRPEVLMALSLVAMLVVADLSLEVDFARLV
jgi:hypothetical protein